MVAFALAMVGALNWGLMALFNTNVVSMLLGSMPMVEKVVYVLVGASAVYLVANHAADCKTCK
jgi:uncharacterized protein